MVIKAFGLWTSLLCANAQLVNRQDPSFDDGNKLHTRVQNCFSSVCPDLAAIPGAQETEAIDEISCSSSNEILRLNINDPREKLLYFRAEVDWNGALKPKASSKIINAFYNKFDMKYIVIKSYNEICEEIQEAIKTGKLNIVVIDAHGWPDHIKLSKDNWINRSVIHAAPFCFSGLESFGKIFLFSCCTAAPGNVRNNDCFAPPRFPNGLPLDPDYQPFAQAMADNTKRQVIAAESMVRGAETQIISHDPFMVFHSQDNTSANLFKVFTPKFENPDYKAVASVAAEALKNSDPLIRDHALDLFQELFDQGQGFDAAISAATEAFQNTDSRIRDSALSLLGKLVDQGYCFKTATDAATELFHNTDREIRAAALDLFGKLFDKEQGFDAAIGAATEAFKSEDLEIPLDALTLFGKLFDTGQGFDAAIGAANKARKSKDFWVRASALELLKKSVKKGYGIKAACSAATEAFTSTDYTNHRQARALFQELFDKGEGFDAAIGAATKAFQSANFVDRSEALDLFESLVDNGQGCDAARSAAASTLNSTDYHMHSAARRLLAKLDKSTQ